MMSLSSLPALFAEAAAPAAPATPQGATNPLTMVGWMAIMVFMFYFLFIRPQNKKAKEHAELLKTVRPGDKVVTSGGIHGVILTVKEKTISIRSGESKLEIQKGAISEVLERGSEAS
jgi:preprotein translocase subunit YajC